MSGGRGAWNLFRESRISYWMEPTILLALPLWALISVSSAPGRPVWIVYGAMRDKAIEEVTSELFPLAERVIATAPNFPRALRPEAILSATDHPNAMVAESVHDAIEIAVHCFPRVRSLTSGAV